MTIRRQRTELTLAPCGTVQRLTALNKKAMILKRISELEKQLEELRGLVARLPD